MTKPSPAALSLFPEMEPAALAAQAMVNAAEALKRGAAICVHVSGGGDSQAMTDLLCDLCDSVGVPRTRLVLMNADLGRAEWPVEAHLRGMAKHYGVALVIVRAKEDLISHIARRGRWPSMAQRYCTSDHKRGPLQKALRAYANEHGWAEVISATGERADESPRRRKLLPWALDEALSAPSKGRTVYNWRPVLTASRDDVFARIAKSGYPPHPVYAEGMRRLSCSFCVFGSMNDLRVAKRLRPDLYAELVELEARMGHKFRDGFALADLDRAKDDGLAGPA